MTTKTKKRKANKSKANKRKASKSKGTNGAATNGAATKTSRTNSRKPNAANTAKVDKDADTLINTRIECTSEAETTRRLLCESIQQVKRHRDMTMKSRIMIENRLGSCAATVIGYQSNMTEEERREHWAKAKKLSSDILRDLVKSDNPIPFDIRAVENVTTLEDKELIIFAMVRKAVPAVKSFRAFEKEFEDRMCELVVQLDIWPWVESIRGVSKITLANVIGETGDLMLYETVGKVWKRMGVAPFEKDGETHMGQSWKYKKWHDTALTADDWVEFGYCARRRSVMYNVAKGMKMACMGKNATREGADNEYIRRYHEAGKVAKKLHPDWTPGHLQSHSLLLTGKRFLRNLWVEWTQPVGGGYPS